MGQVVEDLTNWLYLTDDPTSRTDKMGAACGADCHSDEWDRWYLIQFQLCTLGFSLAISITLIGCSEMCVISRSLGPLSVASKTVCKATQFRAEVAELQVKFTELHLAISSWLFLREARDTFCRRFAANTDCSQSTAVRYLNLAPSLRRQDPGHAGLRRALFPTASLVTTLLTQPRRPTSGGESEICFSETTYACCSFWDSALEALHKHDWQKIRTCTSAYLYGSGEPNPEAASVYGADGMKNGCFWSNGTGFLRKKSHHDAGREENNGLQPTRSQNTLLMNRVGRMSSTHHLVSTVSNSPYTPPVRFINIGKTQGIIMTTHSLAGKKGPGGRTRCAPVYNPRNPSRRLQPVNAEVSLGRVVSNPNVDDATSDLLCGDVSLIVNKYSFTKDPTGDVEAEAQATELHDTQKKGNHDLVTFQNREGRRYNSRPQDGVKKKGDMQDAHETGDKKEENIKHADKLKRRCKQSKTENTQTRGPHGQPSERLNLTNAKASNVPSLRLPERHAVEQKWKRYPAAQTQGLASSIPCSHPRNDTLVKTTGHQGKDEKMLLETSKQQPPGGVTKVEKRGPRIVPCREKNRTHEKSMNEMFENLNPADAGGLEPADNELRGKVTLGKQQNRLTFNGRKSPGTHGLHEVTHRLAKLSKNIPHVPETAKEHPKNKYRTYWKSKPCCGQVDGRHANLKATVENALKDLTDCKHDELVHLTKGCSNHLQKTVAFLKCFYERIDQCPTEWKGPYPRKSYVEKFRPYKIAQRAHSFANRGVKREICINNMVALEQELQGDGQVACVANDTPSVGVRVCCSQHQAAPTSPRHVHEQFGPGTSYKTCDAVAFLDFFLHLPAFLQQQQQQHHPAVKEVSKTKIPQKFLGRPSAATAGAGVNDLQQAKRIANQMLDKNKKRATCTEVLRCLSSLSATASEYDVKDNAGEYNDEPAKMATSHIPDYFSNEVGHEKQLDTCGREEFNTQADLCKKSLYDMPNAINCPWHVQQANPQSTRLKVATEYCSVRSNADHSTTSIDSFTISTLHQVTSFTEQLHSNRLYQTDADHAKPSTHSRRETAAGEGSIPQFVLATTGETGRDPDWWAHRSKIPLPVSRKLQLKSQQSDTGERRPESQMDPLFPNGNGRRTVKRNTQGQQVNRERTRNGSPVQRAAGREATWKGKPQKAMKYQVVVTDLPKVEPRKAEPHKVEAHKVEAHKVEPHKVEPHEGEPHKVELRKVEPHKVELRKVEPHKVELHTYEPHKVELHKVRPHKIELHKFEPLKVEPHKVEPYKVELHNVEQHQAIIDPSQAKPQLHKATTGSHEDLLEGKTQTRQQGRRDNRRPHRHPAGWRTADTQDASIFRCRTSAPKFPNKPNQRPTDLVRHPTGLDRFSRGRRHTTPTHGHVHNRDNCLRYSRPQTQRSTWPPNSGSPDSLSTRVPSTHKTLFSSLPEAGGTGENADNRANISREQFQDRKDKNVVPVAGHCVEGQWLHSASDEALLVSLDDLDRRLEGIHTHITDSNSRTFVKEAGPLKKRATQEHGSEDKRLASQRVTPGLKDTKLKSRSRNEVVNVSKVVEESRIRPAKVAGTPTPNTAAGGVEAPQSQTVEEKQKSTEGARRQPPTSFTKQSMSEHRPKLCRPGVRTFYRICDHVTQPCRRPRSRGYEAKTNDPAYRQNRDASLSTPLAKMVMAAIDKHSRGLSPDRWRNTMELQQSMKHPRSSWRPTSHGTDNKVPHGPSLAHYPHISPQARSPSQRVDRGKTAHEIRHRPEGALPKAAKQPVDVQEAGGERQTAITGDNTRDIGPSRYAEDERLVKPVDSGGVRASSSKQDTIDKSAWRPAQSKQSYEHDQSKTAKENDTNEELHLEGSTASAKNHAGVPVAGSNGKLGGKIPTTNKDTHVCAHQHRKTSRDALLRNKAKSTTPTPGSRPCSRRREKASKKRQSRQESPCQARTDEDKSRPTSKMSTGTRSPDQIRTRNTTVSLKIHPKDTIQSLSSSENASCKKQKSVCSNSSKNLGCATSRTEQVRSPTDQFTEVECPDEKNCRRTKLVRTVPEDLLVSFWSRKTCAAASDRTKKKAILANKCSSKENTAKEKRQEAQQLPIPGFGSRGLGHIAEAGNPSPIKCEPRGAIKLPATAQGLFGEHQESERVQGSVEDALALDQDSRAGSVTYSIQRWTSAQDHSMAETVHNVAPVSRDSIHVHLHGTNDMVSTTTKDNVEDRWPKRGSKSDHCWKKQYHEQSSQNHHHLTESMTPEVLATISVPLLAGKGGHGRSSPLSADILPTLSSGHTGPTSLQEPSVPGVWSFESDRKWPSSTTRLEEISQAGPRGPPWPSGSCFNSRPELTTSRMAADDTSLERYVANADAFNAIVQGYPLANREGDSSGRWEATDNPPPPELEGNATSENVVCQPALQIPPEFHISWQKFLSVIFTDPACLSKVKHSEDNITRQTMKAKQTVFGQSARQDSRAAKQSSSQDRDTSSQDRDTSSKDHFSDTNLSMKDQTDVVCQQSASEHWHQTCFQHRHKGASSSRRGQKHRRLVNPSGLSMSSRRTSAAEIRVPESVDRLFPYSRCPQETLSWSREEQHTLLFPANDSHVNKEKNVNSNKESKLRDGGHSTQGVGATDCAKDNTEEFGKTRRFEEVTDLHENKELDPTMSLNRVRREISVGDRNRFVPSRISKRVVGKDHCAAQRAARQHAHFVSKLPVASKQVLHEQPSESRHHHQHDRQDAGKAGHEPLSLENDRSSWIYGASIKRPETEQGHPGADADRQSQKDEERGLRSAQGLCSRMLGSQKCLSGRVVGHRKSSMKDNCQTMFVVNSNLDHCRNRTCKHEGSEGKSLGSQPGKRRRQPEASLQESISAHKGSMLTRPASTDQEQEPGPRKHISVGRSHNCTQPQHAACPRPLSWEAQQASSILRRNDTGQPPSVHSVRSCQSKCFLLTAGSSAASVSPPWSNSTPRVKAKVRNPGEPQPSRNLGKRANRTPLHNSPVRRLKGRCGGRATPADSAQMCQARNNLQYREQSLNKNRALLKAHSTQKLLSAGAPLAYTYPEPPGDLNPERDQPSPDSLVPSSSGLVVSLGERLLPELKITHAHGGHTQARSSLHAKQTDIRPIAKPHVGFSYLFHDVSEIDSRHLMAPPFSDHGGRHHTSLRIKPPKEDSFVGKIVKMFENRFHYLPSEEDSQKHTEDEQSG